MRPPPLSAKEEDIYIYIYIYTYIQYIYIYVFIFSLQQCKKKSGFTILVGKFGPHNVARKTSTHTHKIYIVFVQHL